MDHNGVQTWISRHPDLNTYIHSLMETISPWVRKGYIEKIIIPFTHDASGVVQERFTFSIRECLVKNSGGVNVRETKEALKNMLIQIIFSEYKLPNLKEGCSFTVQLQTYEVSPAVSDNMNKNGAWQETSASKTAHLRDADENQDEAMMLTPIRTVETSLLHLELVVESKTA